MKKLIESWLSTILVKRSNKKNSLLELVNEAKINWLNAVKTFNEVSEKELIDFTVYHLNASEEQYIYLLKLCREKGIKNYNVEIR